MSDSATWLRMQVLVLSVDPLSNLPIVVLVDDQGVTHLPIAVGLGEASAIAAELEGIELERPMTHQLTCQLLARTGARVRHVELDGNPAGAVVARIALELADGSSGQAEARPSDAVAIALACHVAILVAPVVLAQADRAGVPIRPDAAPGLAEAGAELLAALDAGSFGKWKM